MAQDCIVDGNLITDDRPLAIEVQNDVLTVDGPLTDAELRATAVPVDGPLTDAELRAVAVPVSGPLTDAELRATPPAVEIQGRADTVLTTPQLDPATSTLQMISYVHQKIHAGDSFALEVTEPDLDTADLLILAFTTADTAEWLHVIVTVSNSAACLFEILEGPTITLDTGTDCTPYNRDRNSDHESGILSIKTVPVANQATCNPTITDDGTVIWTESLGGNKNQGSAAGVSNRDEWILRQDTTYAFRMTGVADNGVASVALHWYELENIA